MARKVSRMTNDPYFWIPFVLIVFFLPAALAWHHQRPHRRAVYWLTLATVLIPIAWFGAVAALVWPAKKTETFPAPEPPAGEDSIADRPVGEKPRKHWV
jgi:hypothetical protein